MSQSRLTTLTPPLLITKGKQKKASTHLINLFCHHHVVVLKKDFHWFWSFFANHWHPNERVESGGKGATFGFHFHSDGDAGSYYYDGGEEYGKYSEYNSQYNLYQGRGLKMQVTIILVPGLTIDLTPALILKDALLRAQNKMKIKYDS